jgi:Kdo2-lipid IVA lauroyltransferase/acyltransferase
MWLTKIRKSFTQIFVRALVEFSSLIVRNASQKSIYVFSGLMGRLLCLAFYKHRKIAFAGLESAFGNELNLQERKRIVEECFIAMAKSAGELLYLIHRPYFVRKIVRIRNAQILEKALESGKGVILVSAHFGNFPLMLAKLSLEGYKTAVIMRPLKAGRVAEIFEAERARFDIETVLSIPRRACVEGAIRSLRNNRALLIPLDQNFGTSGVFVDFFGAKAATATGPVVLAQRTGAAILPCFIVRRADDTHDIIFEQPIRLEKGANEEETIVINIQKITRVIEKYIREYPSLWSWIHRRWKAQPRKKQG